MNVFEFIFTVISIVALVDLLKHYISYFVNKELIRLMLIAGDWNTYTKVKIIVEKLLVFVCMLYWIYKIFFGGI